MGKAPGRGFWSNSIWAGLYVQHFLFVIVLIHLVWDLVCLVWHRHTTSNLRKLLGFAPKPLARWRPCHGRWISRIKAAIETESSSHRAGLFK